MPPQNDENLISRAPPARFRESGRVEDGRGCSGRLGRRGPVSRPRSSNRTCGFPASGSPTGFIPQAIAGGGPKCIRRRPITPNLPNTTWSLNCRAPRDDTFLRLLRFEIELLLQVEIFYGVSDSCQSPDPPLPPKRARRQGPWLPRSYPASALLWPCPTPRRARPPCEDGGVANSTRRGTSLPALRSPFTDMPCPLPRRTEPVPVSVASRSVLLSPYLRRVGVRDFPFEACSGWTARYGLPACSPGFLRTLSRGFREANYSTAPLVGFHAYRQLHRWAPSSHRVSAPKRRTEKCGLALLGRSRRPLAIC